MHVSNRNEPCLASWTACYFVICLLIFFLTSTRKGRLLLSVLISLPQHTQDIRYRFFGIVEICI